MSRGGQVHDPFVGCDTLLDDWCNANATESELQFFVDLTLEDDVMSSPIVDLAQQDDDELHAEGEYTFNLNMGDLTTEAPWFASNELMCRHLDRMGCPPSGLPRDGLFAGVGVHEFANAATLFRILTAFDPRCPQAREHDYTSLMRALGSIVEPATAATFEAIMRVVSVEHSYESELYLRYECARAGLDANESWMCLGKAVSIKWLTVQCDFISRIHQRSPLARRWVEWANAPAQHEAPPGDLWDGISPKAWVCKYLGY